MAIKFMFFEKHIRQNIQIPFFNIYKANLNFKSIRNPKNLPKTKSPAEATKNISDKRVALDGTMIIEGY
jgi:hypothetical protein